MHHELVGRRGIFLDPALPTWWEQQSGQARTAEGDWYAICKRALQNIRALAALAEMQRRYPQVGVVQLCTGIKSFFYGLPRQYDECIKCITAFAVLTARVPVMKVVYVMCIDQDCLDSETPLCSIQPFYDP